MKKRSLYNKKKMTMQPQKKTLMYGNGKIKNLISVEMGKGIKFNRKKSDYQIFSCLFNIRIEKPIANK